MWPFELFSVPNGVKTEMRAKRFHGSCHGGKRHPSPETSGPTVWIENIENVQGSTASRN